MGPYARLAVWVVLVGTLGVARAGDEGAAGGGDSSLPDLLPFGAARVAGWPAADGVDEAWRSAVAEGLRWLAAHQSASGGWEAAAFGRICDGRSREGPGEGLGDAAYDVGVTGMALTAFLGAGVVPGAEGPYGETVARGLTRLADGQDAQGCIGPRGVERFVYNHAWATLALVEGYGLSGDARWRAPAARALDFIAAARNPDGGWRYGVRPGDSDTSATATMAMALYAARRINRAAEAAGLRVPLPGHPEAWEGIEAWIDRVTDGGRAGYREKGGGPARYPEWHGEGAKRFPPAASEAPTAAVLLLRLRMGAHPRKKVVKEAVDIVLATPPRWDPDAGTIDLVYWHDAALALVLHGRRSWSPWQDALADALVARRRTDTDVCAQRGSWDPVGAWGAAGGRVYATALAVLTLLAPVRYEDGDPARELDRLVRDAGVAPEARARLFAALAVHDRAAYEKLVDRALGGREPELLLAALGSVNARSAPSGKDLDRVASLARSGKDEATRVAALGAIGRLGAKAEGHVDAVLLAAEDPSEPVAGAARKALVALAPTSGRARLALESMLHVTDPVERLLAAGQLLRVDPDHARARSVLEEGLEADDPEHRAAAARGLGLEVPAWARPSKVQLLAAAEAGLPVAFENRLGMRFLLVPAGTFTMGSPPDEKGRLPDETPHQVTLTRPYYLQMTEVTNAQIHRWNSKHHSGHFGTTNLTTDDRPVLKLTHLMAQVFAEWVDAEDPRHRYRLPTEAEWEYAARAGTTTRYWWGEDEQAAGRHENVADLTAKTRFKTGFGAGVETTPGWRWFDTEDGHEFTAPVASFPPNPWGFYDMLGNAAEWVEDWRNRYPSGAVVDPQPDAHGDVRVFRGGSWVASPHQSRAAMRGLLAGPAHPGDAALWIGLRLVAEPLPSR